MYVNKSIAEKILGRNKNRDLKKRSSTKSTLNKKIKKSILFATKNKEKIITGKNVLGYIEGSDPELKKELIVITAHHDHIGIIDGEIHNGADDNASGTAGLLEIAATFQLAKKLGLEFKRSILCMPVSGRRKRAFGLILLCGKPRVSIRKYNS